MKETMRHTITQFNALQAIFAALSSLPLFKHILAQFGIARIFDFCRLTASGTWHAPS